MHNTHMTNSALNVCKAECATMPYIHISLAQRNVFQQHKFSPLYTPHITFTSSLQLPLTSSIFSIVWCVRLRICDEHIYTRRIRIHKHTHQCAPFLVFEIWFLLLLSPVFAAYRVCSKKQGKVRGLRIAVLPKRKNRPKILYIHCDMCVFMEWQCIPISGCGRVSRSLSSIVTTPIHFLRKAAVKFEKCALHDII